MTLKDMVDIAHLLVALVVVPLCGYLIKIDRRLVQIEERLRWCHRIPHNEQREEIV